jgi:hypothetical protein
MPSIVFLCRQAAARGRCPREVLAACAQEPIGTWKQPALKCLNAHIYYIPGYGQNQKKFAG